jgi:hypothetical protein
MFHGQPHCDSCGYEGPDFMWMPHHNWGFGALIQDRQSFELRVVEVPDNEVFYPREGRTTAETDYEKAEYVESVLASQLRPGERHVPLQEFARFATAGEEESSTDLPCPRCRALLRWRHTGIS